MVQNRYQWAGSVQFTSLIFRLERYKTILFLFSFLYLPLVTFFLQYLATRFRTRSLFNEIFPRFYLFSIYVAIALYFLPRLLHVRYSRSPSALKASGAFYDDFWMQHTYFPKLRLLLRHSHHEPGSRGFRHELCVKNKCICTGCYGTALGIVVSLIIIILYLVFALLSRIPEEKEIHSIFDLDLSIIMIIGSWVTFSLFLLKYIVPLFKKPVFRLMLNPLLPLSLIMLLIGLDLQHGNALILVLAAVLLLPLIPVRVILTRLEEYQGS